jgi:hypothetical protein
MATDFPLALSSLGRSFRCPNSRILRLLYIPAGQPSRRRASGPGTWKFGLLDTASKPMGNGNPSRHRSALGEYRPAENYARPGRLIRRHRGEAANRLDRLYERCCCFTGASDTRGPAACRNARMRYTRAGMPLPLAAVLRMSSPDASALPRVRHSRRRSLAARPCRLE